MKLARLEFPPLGEGRKHSEGILFKPLVEKNRKKHTPEPTGEDSNVLKGFSVRFFMA